MHCDNKKTINYSLLLLLLFPFLATFLLLLFLLLPPFFQLLFQASWASLSLCFIMLQII